MSPFLSHLPGYNATGSPEMHIHYRIAAAALLFALGSDVTGQSREENALQKERSNLERTSNAVDRTKIQIKIADLLITLLASAARAGNDPLVEQHLKDYSETIQNAHQAMMKSGKDAHKHPAGFKDLEIALRKQQHRLDDAGKLLAY